MSSAFILNAIVTILLHMAPNIIGASVAVYEHHGIHVVYNQPRSLQRGNKQRHKSLVKTHKRAPLH